MSHPDFGWLIFSFKQGVLLHFSYLGKSLNDLVVV